MTCQAHYWSCSAALHKVMDLDLATREDLANADIDTVRAQLADSGYYLQMVDNPVPGEKVGSLDWLEGLQ